MKFLKKIFSNFKNEEKEYLKERVAKAEEILSRINKDPNTKISFKISLDIWDFLNSEEINTK